ncbi:MAG: tRNA 2-thiouridine(34) synthase MnmA, partial [Thermodesulfobacteriota bacterium]|nr:tRNA 2-thiouridine(34) synthase MnmA [Thermodesulfobacteriota bacterium]
MNNKISLTMKTGVALSGGADSLLALALGREQGMDVFAAHAYFLPPTSKMRGHANELSRICKSLNVPFHVFDLSREFEAGIIKPFVQEYASGRTPNPCALCNARIKFGLLMERVRELGAERLATGHFARVTEHPEWGLTLSRGADREKDQSYFLSLVPKKSLKQAVFPLGE